MKKLILKPNAVNKGEVLTRAQLKKVMGGNGSGDGAGSDAGGDSPKIKACKNKKEGDSCSFMYNGSESTGYCRSYAPNYVMHCSNLV